MKYLAVSRRSRLITPTLVLALLLILGALMWSSGAKPRSLQNITSQVANKTRSLQIINAEKNNSNGTDLLFRNVSAKAIAAFTVSVGEVSVEEDFVYSGRVIVPGDIYTAHVPARTPGAEIKILAVVFDDKTGDGDTDAVAAIRDRRAAEKAQLARILPLLQNTLNSPDARLTTALKNLKAQIASLPSTSDEDSSAVKSGLQNARELMLQDIQDFESRQAAQGMNPTNLRQELQRIQAHVQSEIDKL